MQSIIENDRTIDEQCREFAEILGLSEPVSREVLLAALEDETYAHNLLVTRKEPVFLNHLLANPPRQQAPEPAPADQQETSNLELMEQAGKAFLRWAKTGFSVVDDETLARREAACLACSNLQEPMKLLQKLVPSKAVSEQLGQRTGDKVCTLCGCNAGKKMRLPTEVCPDRHPTLEGLTRWGVPIEAGNL